MDILKMSKNQIFKILFDKKTLMDFFYEYIVFLYFFTSRFNIHVPKDYYDNSATFMYNKTHFFNIPKNEVLLENRVD